MLWGPGLCWSRGLPGVYHRRVYQHGVSFSGIWLCCVFSWPAHSLDSVSERPCKQRLLPRGPPSLEHDSIHDLILAGAK